MKYWLSVVDSTHIEGMHNSVMAYGDKLLNACGADASQENDELISLFRINTHFCVLMDSDRDRKGARFNSTKLRIKRECESSGNMSWVTDGGAIENYFPAVTLGQAIKSLYPERIYDWKMGDQYVCPLSGVFTGKKYGPDNSKVARWIANNGYELQPVIIQACRKARRKD